MKELTHIEIHSKAFLLNEEFSANCDEAARQMKIAEAAPDLLAALIYAADALAIHAPDSWTLTQARAAIAKAKGEPS